MPEGRNKGPLYKGKTLPQTYPHWDKPFYLPVSPDREETDTGAGFKEGVGNAVAREESTVETLPEVPDAQTH